ncbi:MAG: hypothetical protein IT244_01375 [Bacteroidia bacterium]|nr:hypothetical protein [Bacteroidia bacterium]
MIIKPPLNEKKSHNINMKKSIIITMLSCLVSSNLFSQENGNVGQVEERKGYVAIHLGSSNPTGDYGSDNFDNSEAAFAKGGAVFDISFGYKLLPNLGLTAVWRGQANSFDAATYAQSMENYLGAGYVSVQRSPYSIGGIMAGVYGSYPTKYKLIIEPRVLCGISTATLPALNTMAYNHAGTKLVTWSQEEATTIAFSYIIGAGSRVDLSKKFCLFLNLDYYAARANWYNVQEISYGHATGTSETNFYNFSHKFSTVNFSGGFGFKF